MFSSTVLDVAIGDVFAFLAISLLTSAVIEAINSVLGLRAKSLLKGIQQIVNDPNFTGLAKTLYEHAAINPRGGAESAAGGVAAPKANPPAYIDKHQFATALLQITGISAAATGNPPSAAAAQAFITALNANVAAIANPQIRSLLSGIILRSQGDLDKIQNAVADWFDSAMDRVGGAFKRWTQLASFIIALVAAVLLNVNSIHLAAALWQHPTLVDELHLPAAVSASGSDMPSAADALNSLTTNLPIGWTPGHYMEVQTSSNLKSPVWVPVWSSFGLILSLLAGCLVTAFATLFGAPFWFDVLQGFVRLKGSGPSPAEKAAGSAASA